MRVSEGHVPDLENVIIDVRALQLAEGVRRQQVQRCFRSQLRFQLGHPSLHQLAVLQEP